MTAARAATGTLSGSIVVVTRPRGDGDGLTEAFRAAGAEVLACPAVEVVDPEDGGAALAGAVAELGRYHWIVFSSANAVRRLLGAVADLRALGTVRLAAVGPATAAALEDHQLVADLVAARPSAEGLVEEFPLCSTSGAAVLFPASAVAARTLPDGLRSKGWAVDEVVAYRTLPAPPPPAAVVRELENASAVTFASPSAVDAYLAARGGGGRPLPVPPVVACIGAATAAAAHAAGLSRVVVARDPSAGALVAAVAEGLAQSAEVAPR